MKLTVNKKNNSYFKKYALIETFYIKKCIQFYNKIIINKD